MPPSQAGIRQRPNTRLGQYFARCSWKMKGFTPPYEIFLLLEETPGVSLRLRGKARQQPTFLTSILRLIQQEFNKNFLQALERRKRVRWPNFENLQRALAAGSVRPDLVALLGGGSITREPPTPTCSSLPPGISNTPSVGRHYPNAPGAEQEGKSVT